ncbi:MAG: septum formation initiator family protein [Proteobacteria bacterium]|nr:septum formation initiator family protein [Pseudomonadota bacterium]
MLMRLRRFDWLVTLGCLALLGYFAWYAFEGPRGYQYLDALHQNKARLEAQLAESRSRQGVMEGKVVLMRPEHIDPDMLEELARTQLELSRPNELIVRYDP